MSLDSSLCFLLLFFEVLIFKQSHLNYRTCMNVQYFETLLQQVKEETDRKKSEAVKKVVNSKLQKLQARFEKCTREKKFLDEVSLNVLCLA